MRVGALSAIASASTGMKAPKLMTSEVLGSAFENGRTTRCSGASGKTRRSPKSADTACSRCFTNGSRHVPYPNSFVVSHRVNSSRLASRHFLTSSGPFHSISSGREVAPVCRIGFRRVADDRLRLSGGANRESEDYLARRISQKALNQRN